MMQNFSVPSSCIFCKEGQDPTSANLFLGPDWPYEGRTIISTKNIFLVPGYGPQVYPYLLLITKRHITSFAQTNYQERQEIFSILHCLVDHSLFGFSSLFVFEHAGCQNLHSCIEHFHFHIIDGRFDLTHALQTFPSTTLELTPTTELEFTDSYLLACRVEKENAIFASLALTKEKQDQFFRRALANKIGEETWDWRLGMNQDLMKRTMEENPRLGRQWQRCVDKYAKEIDS
jgi:diadenosine tetraphosphate (Ap4A) HIT family hydrolase